ncbi:MAG: rhodanese-like domain-containing protein [Saprospiraceae bacterium]|nr:rhodanese-like domain-containing protein [Saprospiraceae bacterium]
MNSNEVKGLTVQELKEMQDSNENYVIIDVREPDETDICSLGGINIPLGLIDQNVDKIPTDKMAVLVCRSGKRSYMATLFLQQEYNLENLYSLNGGIIAYARDIDKSMTLY